MRLKLFYNLGNATNNKRIREVLNIKKYIIIFTITLFSIISQTVFSAEPVLNVILPKHIFSDVPETHWAYTEINELSKQGFIAGYADNNFKPDEFITREEFATLVIKGLKVDDAMILDPIIFNDFYSNDWAWDYVQNAYYYGLLTPPEMDSNGKYLFRPKDNIIRAHAITIAMNALKTGSLSKNKAKLVLEEMYDDYSEIPDWFITNAAKAQLLGMLVINPTKKTKLIDWNKPITRAETAVLVYDMIQEAKNNPSEKIKQSMEKKIVSQGYVLTKAYIKDDSIAVIPTGTILPLMLTKDFSSQRNFIGDKFTALVPKNFVSIGNYLLMPSGTKFIGHISNIQKAKFLIKNGTITFKNDTVEISHQSTSNVNAEAIISAPKNLFKSKKSKIHRGEILELILQQDVYIDSTTGKIIQPDEL